MSIREALRDEVIWLNPYVSCVEWARLLGVHVVTVKMEMARRRFGRNALGTLTHAPCVKCRAKTDVGRLSEGRVCDQCEGAMPKRLELPERKCASVKCTNMLERRPNETAQQFRRRRYCSKPCVKHWRESRKPKPEPVATTDPAVLLFRRELAKREKRKAKEKARIHAAVQEALARAPNGRETLGVMAPKEEAA